MVSIPNSEKLVTALDLKTPIVGIYDTPDVSGFENLESPETGKNACLVRFYPHWQEGKSLHLTRETAGCGGSAYWLFGKETRTRENFIEFLAVKEGLKDSKELMSRWLDHEHPYKPEYSNLVIGPLHDIQFKYLKTVTFFITPDQLSVLTIAAHYFHSPEDLVPPVIVPMGSGCMQMLTILKDLDFPQAVIGSTDISIRKYLPAGLIAFTMTVPMYRQMCALDERSFLYKPFLRNLKESRGKLGDVA